MTMPLFVRIDNQIVEKIRNGIKIGSIKLYEKEHKIKLNLEYVPYVFTGSRLSDSLLMQRLISGVVNYDDLQVVYPALVQ